MRASDRILLLIVIVLLFVSAAAVVYFYNYMTTKTTDCVAVQYDTIVVVERDTMIIRERVKQCQYHYDTIMLHDTVYVADVPQVYTDSTPDYRLAVNAVKMYDYSLDIYRADTFTRYVPQVPSVSTKQSRRGLFGQSIVVGLQVGYGLCVHPSTMHARFEPYVGVGITYGWGYNW